MRHSTTGNHEAPECAAAEPATGKPPELPFVLSQSDRVHSHGGFLDGQMLVAMPGMEDERFARSVIYLCAHSDEGAMGIVINRAAPKVKFPELLVQLDVIGKDEAIRLPRKAGAMQVLTGGPVETGRGFVLHSSDFFIDNSTLPIDDRVSLTATIDILRAIAKGDGPDCAVLALGYAGWQGRPARSRDAGQRLAQRARRHLADLRQRAPTRNTERAVRTLGIDLSRLSSACGRA